MSFEKCCFRDCGIVSQLNCDLNCVLTNVFWICCRQAKSENICAWIEAEDIFVIGRGIHSDWVFPYSTVIDSIKVSCDFANCILDGWERLCARISEHKVSHVSHTEGIKEGTCTVSGNYFPYFITRELNTQVISSAFYWDRPRNSTFEWACWTSWGANLTDARDLWTVVSVVLHFNGVDVVALTWTDTEQVLGIRLRAWTVRT